MRKILLDQLTLVAAAIDHPHAHELQAISERLEQVPETLALIHADLVRGVAYPQVGRAGMTAEQVLRCVLAKQMNSWSYRELAFHLADSLSYRRFCRFGVADAIPKKATLRRNIKRLRAETWEAINRSLLELARADGIENGRQVRTDCTVVETNIHEPTDSSLLWDCVRVLARLMKRSSERVEVLFTNHSRRAKRRFIGIRNAGTKAKRLPLYRDLLKVTVKTVQYAEHVAGALDNYVGHTILDSVAAGALATELRHYITLASQVIDQTTRRVIHGESVPASEKIVSIFEEHTDIIVKDRRETLYGHKIALTTGKSGLVLDMTIEDGNPADSTLALKMVDRQVEIYGRAPRQISFDGAFASIKNLKDIKAAGVKDVCFSKARFLDIEEMVKSTWVYRKLRRFRAGIEAGVSFLKRCFGLDRCHWRGHASFKAYTWASVVAHNLLVLARHDLAKAQAEAEAATAAAA